MENIWLSTKKNIYLLLVKLRNHEISQITQMIDELNKTNKEIFVNIYDTPYFDFSIYDKPNCALFLISSDDQFIIDTLNIYSLDFWLSTKDIKI